MNKTFTEAAMLACDGRCPVTPVLMWASPAAPAGSGRPPVQEPEGPVVDGEPRDAHVVCVEHAVAEAHALPLGHQPGRAPRHLQRDGRRYSVGPALPEPPVPAGPVSYRVTPGGLPRVPA